MMKEDTGNGKASLVRIAYDEIKKNIISGVFEPGQLLYETTLAQEMGMSRLPIHQAIQLLNEEGWFSCVDRKNIRVSSIDPDSVEEIYCIRKIFERSALREVFEKGIFWETSFSLEECLLRMKQHKEDQAMFRKYHYKLYEQLLTVFPGSKLEKLYVYSGMEQLLRINLLCSEIDRARIDELISQTELLIMHIRENRAEEADALYMKLWAEGKERTVESLRKYMSARKSSQRSIDDEK